MKHTMINLTLAMLVFTIAMSVAQPLPAVKTAGKYDLPLTSNAPEARNLDARMLNNAAAESQLHRMTWAKLAEKPRHAKRLPACTLM